MILIKLVCLIVSALSLGLIYRDVVSAAMSYSSELEAAQREGAILTDAEFEKLSAVDPNEDARPLLAPMLARLEKVKSPLYLGNFLQFPFPETVVVSKSNQFSSDEALNAVFDQTGDTSILLSKTKMSFPIERSDPFRYTGSLFWRSYSNLIRAQIVQGLWLARRGDFEASLQSFRIANRLIEFAYQDPNLTGYILARNLESTAFRVMSHAAIYFLKNEERSRQLLALVNEWKTLSDFEPVFKLQSYWALKAAERCETVLGYSATRSNSFDKRIFAARFPIVRRAWQTQALRNIRELHYVAKENHFHPVAIGVASDSLRFRQEADKRVSLWFVIYTGSDFRPSSINERRRLANQELCRASLLALEEWKKLGRWPSKLDHLPRDPFDSRRIRYRVQQNRVVLWSIGRDGKDSGGKSWKEDRKSDDVWIHLPLDPMAEASATWVRTNMYSPGPKKP